MSPVGVLGPAVSATTVEQRIADFVEPFLPDYFALAEREGGWDRGEIERPLSIVPASRLDRWPETQLPVLIVVCPGPTERPERRGDGSYRAKFSVQFAPVVSADSETNTRRLAQAHAFAMRMLVIQHKSFGGFADESAWLGETFDEIPFEQTRTVQAGAVLFEVAVPNVGSEGFGLREPSADPDAPGEWPEATVVDTVVDSYAIEGAFGA
jgi:hypothetical protein